VFDESDIIDPDAPYALADPNERTRREALLTEAHMVPLVTYLRQQIESAT